MKQTFEQKVKSMSAKEIIMAMVEGLQNPVIKVEIDTFGGVENNICYGCAATNAICKISGKTFNIKNIEIRNNRAKFINSDYSFLWWFELAIDHLRQGNIPKYNYYAEELGFAQYAEEVGFAQIDELDFNLPKLTNNYTPEDLQQYINLANAQ